MFELVQNLILNKDIFNSLSEKKRSIFIYEWLCSVNKILITAEKNDIHEYQSRIVEQLLQQIQNVSNPPIRILIGRNLAILFNIDHQSSFFIKTINYCNDILRTNNELAQLTTVVIIGILYQRLGQYLDRSYEETVELLLKILKNGDSQMRCEILLTFEHMINGLGATGRTVHREIHKIAKIHLYDQVMSARSAAAMCLVALINQNNFMYTSELKENITLGLRAFDGSNYEVRCSVAKYLAILLMTSQDSPTDRNQSIQSNISMTNINKIKTIEEIFNYLSAGFLYGNLNFNKTEQLKGSIKIQIGITHTYIELIRILGRTWIEENLSFFIHHLLEIADNLRISSSHIDAIFSRKCIIFILDSVINSQLNEKAQVNAAKELIIIIKRYITSKSIINSSTIYNILICALHQLSLLISYLGTSTFLLLEDSSNGLIDILFLVISNSSPAVRLTTACCFRSIAIALSSMMTSLIDQCLEKMKQLNSSNIDTMSGLTLVLRALLEPVHQCPLGILSQRMKIIFNFANNLLRTTIASTIGQEQSCISHFILQRTSIAWHLLSTCCIFDQYLLRKFLPRLILLWRNVFSIDFEQEKQRGDSLTWILSFNQRSGALSTMISFLNNYSIIEKNLSSNELIKYMINPIENALHILFYIPNLLKQFGHQLKISTTIFRLRLYELILLIPNQFYEGYFQNLLKELINEFTLVDNSLNTITTSLFKSICYDNNYDLLGNCLQEVDYQIIEEQYHSLENDRDFPLSSDNSHSTELNLAMIDTSIQLFSKIFPHISNKQRLNLFQYFLDLIKQSKDAIQINILTTVLLSLKTLAESKLDNNDNLKRCTCTLIIHTLNHSNPILRCIAAEAFGRLIQIMSDEYFITNIIRFCFDRLQESCDIPSRTGYLLAFACSYRYLDYMSKQQYLSLSMPILHTFIEDQSTTIIQIWTLHVLKLIVDSSGHMFQSYIEPLLDVILHLLLSTSSSQIDIYQYCGRLLNSLIINMNENLQILYASCLTVINILQIHVEPVIQVEAIQALQKLYLSIPQYVNLSMLLPKLIQGLTSRDLSLRRVCSSCLRQLLQRETEEISEHVKDSSLELTKFRSLEELLFSILNTEIDTSISSNIQDILVHMLQTFRTDNHLTHWLQLCNDILTTTDTSSIKWQTKVFAINCVEKLIKYDEQTLQSNLYFDSIKQHLPILITSSYLACTSTHDSLRLSGLSLLKQIILKFTYIEQNTDLSDNVLLLKQYQPQINAALRPAFSQRTPSPITAQACDVCWIWISSNSIDDFKCFHQLLILSLKKFLFIQEQTPLLIENLAILKLWADVYNLTVIQDKTNRIHLIQEEIYILIHHWLDMLTDYAFLMLPKEFNNINYHNENFYLIDLTRKIYKANWLSIMQAVTQWLVEHYYELEILPKKKEDIFVMLFACCIDALSISISEQTDETIEKILISLMHLLRLDISISQITKEIYIELIHILQRLCLIHNDIKIHLKILEILEIIINKDHIIPGELFFKLLISILLNYFPTVNDNSQLYSIFLIKIITLIIPLFHKSIHLYTLNQNIQQLIPILLSISFLLFSSKSNEQKSLLSQILQLIKNLFHTSINKTISHNLINTIINLRINLREKDLSDNGFFIQCLTSLIINSNSVDLSKQILDFYRKAFDDRDFETHLHIIQCLNELFQLRNFPLRNKFIQIFTPVLLMDLKQTDNQQQIIEILKIFERILSIVNSTPRGPRLALLIIPLFIHFLPDSTLSNIKIDLTSYITERLQYFLSIYPNEFHSILETTPDLQVKLKTNHFGSDLKFL